VRTETLVVGDPFGAVGSAVKTMSALTPRRDGCDCGCGTCGEKSDPPPAGRVRPRLDPDMAAMAASAVTGPVSRRRNAVELKVAARFSAGGSLRRPVHGVDDVVVMTKVGLVSTNSGVGRAAQSVVSYAIPGDMSRVRSPIRSTVYRGLTPGGGGRGGLVGRIGGQQVVNRCPPGFEHGGRFANSTFTNCGRQLFEAVQGLVDAARSATRGGSFRADNTPAPSILRGVPVRAGKYTGEAGRISRAANVPVMGKPSAKKMEEAVASMVAAANSADGPFVRLVRADGVVFSPVSDIKRIARQRKNPDMDGGTWVVALNSPSNIGGEELSLLGAGVRSVRYAVPGSGEIRVDSAKPVGQARMNALIRKLQSARSGGDENGSALREMVRQSAGTLAYSESFPNVDNPNEMVVIARGKERKTVPRWVYEAWHSDKSSGKDKSSGWTVVDTVTNVSQRNEVGANAVVEATAESLSALSSFDRGKAIAKGKSVDIGAGRRSVTMKDGTTWVAHPSEGNSHLGIVVGNDIAASLGLAAPNSYIAGDGDGRYAVVQSPADIPGVKLAKDETTGDIPADELARIAIADYLTDNRGRTPATVIPADGKHPAVVASSARNARAHGVKGGDGAGFGDYLKQDGSSKWIVDKVAQMEAIKQKVAAMYEQMLERAEKFDWDAYMDRLSIAGLTAGEKTHLETIRSLYLQRVKQMRSSRRAFLTALGVAS
jgi:hypothetical protein